MNAPKYCNCWFPFLWPILHQSDFIQTIHYLYIFFHLEGRMWACACWFVLVWCVLYLWVWYVSTFCFGLGRSDCVSHLNKHTYFSKHGKLAICFGRLMVDLHFLLSSSSWAVHHFLSAEKGVIFHSNPMQMHSMAMFSCFWLKLLCWPMPS